jgi:hypothetical protein
MYITVHTDNWLITYDRLWQKTDPPSRQRGRHPQGQNRNCQKVSNIWSCTPDGARYQDRQTDWPSVAMWLRLRQITSDPCGGGVEYFHRDPASRRRRRKGKSQNWDSKIWLRHPRDSDPRKTALASTSSIYKRQTRPLVREGAPQKQERNCQTIINIWSWAPGGARHQDLLIDRPSVAMLLWLWL